MKIEILEATQLEVNKGEVVVSTMSGKLLAKFATDGTGSICQMYPPKSQEKGVCKLTEKTLRNHIVRNDDGQVINEYQTYS
jgi:hypothetical protein